MQKKSVIVWVNIFAWSQRLFYLFNWKKKKYQLIWVFQVYDKEKEKYYILFDL